MQDQIFEIHFSINNKKYKGWVNPSDKLSETGRPISFHVVIDDTSYGYLSYHNAHWVTNEQRPQEITDAVGAEIEKYYGN